MSPENRRPSVYFLNPVADYALAGGLSMALAAAMAAFYRPTRTEAVIVIAAQLLWICNWPHFSATSHRLYHRWENIRQYPITALVIPWVILAVAAWSIASPDLVAPAFVKLYFIWSPYHFAGQTVGVTALYLRRAGVEVRPWERKVYGWAIYSAFVSIVLRSESGERMMQFYGISFPSLGLPAWVATAGLAYAHVATAALGVCYLLWCRRAGRLVPPIVLVPALALQTWFVWTKGVASFLEFVPFFHSLQYLLVAWSMQLKERKDREGIAGSPRYVWRESVRWYLLNVAGGAVLFWVLPRAVAGGFDLSLAVTMGVLSAAVQVHHFFVDGVIWKLKRETVASPLMGDLHDLLHAPAPARPVNR
jgi:hypothetical protein